jgi:hypothetical protein
MRAPAKGALANGPRIAMSQSSAAVREARGAMMLSK